MHTGKRSNLKGPRGAQPSNLDTPVANNERWLLGEGEDVALERAMPKEVHDGVGVGEFIYSLKDLQDVTGSVSVGAAMDLLMKCNRDGDDGHSGNGKSKSKEEQELGMSYSPNDSANFNMAQKTSEAAGSNDGAGNPPSDCMTNTIENTLENILVPATDKCKSHCSTSGIDYEAFTSECTGGGDTACFLQASETYYRSVSGSFLSWKRQCASYHNSDAMLTKLTT